MVSETETTCPWVFFSEALVIEVLTKSDTARHDGTLNDDGERVFINSTRRPPTLFDARIDDGSRVSSIQDLKASAVMRFVRCVLSASVRTALKSVKTVELIGVESGRVRVTPPPPPPPPESEGMLTILVAGSIDSTTSPLSRCLMTNLLFDESTSKSH
eukprot:2631738-Pleurochrysis_carterae.AAC.1